MKYLTYPGGKDTQRGKNYWLQPPRALSFTLSALENKKELGWKLTHHQKRGLLYVSLGAYRLQLLRSEEHTPE